MNKPSRSFGCNVALARKAKCVATVETSLNMALAHDPVRKVVLLSHSAASNFDGEVNAVMLGSTASCHPCHRLHVGFTHCHQDQRTTAAACQASKKPEDVAGAILS